MALAAVMLLGLCSCKGLPNGDKPNNDKKKGTSTSSDLGKQFVYRFQEFDFSGLAPEGEAGADSYIESVTEVDGRIYLIMQCYSKEGTDEYKLVSMDMEGKDMQVHDFQKSMDNEGDGGESEASESGEAGGAGAGGAEIMPLSYDSAVNVTAMPVMAASAAVDLPAEEPAGDNVSDGDAVEEPEISNIYENTNFGSFRIAGGQYVYGSKNYYYENYSDPDNPVSMNKRYLCCWDLEGNMLWETPLEILSQEDKWYNINMIIGLENGNALLLITGDENGKISVDKEGNVSELQPVSEELAKCFEQSGNYVQMPDDQLLITYYDQDWTDMYVVTYDIKSDSLNESFQLPATMTSNGMGNVSVDKNKDLIYCNNQGVYKYHIGDAEPVQLMSFVNSDLYINSLNAVMPIDDESFVGVYTEYDEETYVGITKGGLFTKVPPEEIPDKQIMVLGGNYIPGDMRKRVVDYNKASSTHRIVLKDYSQYNTYEDWEASFTKLNNDIISGSMPDILIVSDYNMPMENYISKGLLANIDEMISKDEELSQMEFVENAFQAARVDGKLYEIIPSFYVQSYVGKKSLVGDRTAWTMEDARKVLETMPEGASMFGEMTRGSFFSTVMSMCGSDFVDVATGKCNFDSEEFIALMEFAKELPEEMGDDYYGDDWYANYQSQYRENRTLLANCYISSTQDLVYTINGSFGEDVSFVGFPTSSGQGSVISYNNNYALAAGSSNLDAAWEFMRYYLTEEYQETLNWQLPVSKTQFDKQAEKALKKRTYTDADGKEVEEDYTYWINDEEIVIDPLTKEQLDEVKQFITSVTKRSYYNQNVINIIDEEMAAYYQGQKSAKDVAGIIQSRAQIYVNENR